MRLLAHRGAVTIVGDPDQGIYGFRYAQAINLEKMTQRMILFYLIPPGCGLIQADINFLFCPCSQNFLVLRWPCWKRTTVPAQVS
jgi:hypothetical protein